MTDEEFVTLCQKHMDLAYKMKGLVDAGANNDDLELQTVWLEEQEAAKEIGRTFKKAPGPLRSLAKQNANWGKVFFAYIKYAEDPTIDNHLAIFAAIGGGAPYDVITGKMMRYQ